MNGGCEFQRPPGRIIRIERSFLGAPVTITCLRTACVSEVVHSVFPGATRNATAEPAIVHHRFSPPTDRSPRTSMNWGPNRFGATFLIPDPTFGSAQPGIAASGRILRSGTEPFRSLILHPSGPSLWQRRTPLGRTNMSQAESALEELHREHEFAERLLERLVEVGERVKSGEQIDPKTLRFGVGLLEAYLHRVHASQMDRELRPEARKVAMPGCFEHLDRMGANHVEMRRRAKELFELIHRWDAGDESPRGAIGDQLIALASLDHDVAAYEETYPLMCLQTVLSEEASNRLSGRFADHAGTRTALEKNVERFLTYTEANQVPR
jgi:hemerythrin-like domain-containing protein